MSIANNTAFRKLLLFVAGALVLNFFLSIFAFRILPYDTNRRYNLDAAFAQMPDSLTYLFIGNSHMNRGIDRDSFPNSFMFHGPTETAPYYYYRLKHILESDGPKAEYYVIPGEIGVAAFNPQPLMFMGDYWKRYVDFTELARNSERPFYYYGIGLKLRVMPYYQFPASLLFMRDLRQERNHYRQFLRDTWADYGQGMRDSILDFIMERHTVIDALASFTGLAYVQKLGDLCAENEIALIVVKFPLHPDYRNAAKARGFISEREVRQVDKLLQSCPSSRIIDFERLYDGQDTMFLDPHHLSKTGKEHFTLILRDTLESIRESDKLAGGSPIITFEF